jgi:hypothetical protein
VIEDVEAQPVGAVHPEQAGDGLVDLVGGALVGTDGVAEGVQQVFATERFS